MAGPCFSLYYNRLEGDFLLRIEGYLQSISYNWQPSPIGCIEFFVKSDIPILSPFLAPKGKKVEKVNSGMFLYKVKSIDWNKIEEYEALAIQEALGWIPHQELSICAMVNGWKDWDRMWMMAENIIKLGDAWVWCYKLDSRLKQNDNRIKTIRARDYSSYFGDRPVDPEYQLQYEKYVPEKLSYFYAAELIGRSVVQK